MMLVSSWADGVFVVDGEHELAGKSVQGLTMAGDSVFGIVDRHALCRRTDGVWNEVARSELPLACCLVTGGDVFVGTDDNAQLLRLVGSELQRVDSFDRVPGRETWYAGAALIDGKWMGPPLGIRSMSAAGDALFANVHVGGIPRSIDGGASWQPTIDVDADVHQVAGHPSRAELVAAASARGLCVSSDGGATWQIETAGLDHAYCSAVAWLGDDILVAASESHFATAGAVYRRSRDGLARVRGLPPSLDGIVDTANIAVRERRAAIVDHGGHVYVSEDGERWREAARVSAPSGVLML